MDDSDILGAMRERTGLIFEEQELQKLASCSVLLAGLGGVGGAACEVLVRMGVGTLILIDGDTVVPSNLNRQIIATTHSLGHDKVQTAAQRAISINPGLKIIKRREFLHKENIQTICSSYNIDIIIDAIDSVGSKAQLIAYAKQHDICVVSALGAAQRRDPASFKIVDLFSTSYDPLARSLRKALRKMGISKNVLSIFSCQEPIMRGSEVAKQQGEKFLGSYVASVLVAGALLAHAAIELFLNEQNLTKNKD
jgi:tRNA threonylcarbamoyladenosine dehydratase